MLKVVVVLFSVFLVMIPATASAIYEVILLEGQSNIKGFEKANLTPEQQAIPINAKFYTGPKRIKSFSKNSILGPEVSFIHTVCAARPHVNFIFYKYSVNGSSLYAWSPEWEYDKAEIANDGKLGPIYQIAMDHLRDIIGTRKVHFSSIIWMQGEADSNYKTAALAYRANIETLIQAFREDLKSEHLPFILGLINPATEYADVVIQAQLDAAAQIPQTHAVTTHNLPKCTDNLHYNKDGAWRLGYRFAAKYLEVTR